MVRRRRGRGGRSRSRGHGGLPIIRHDDPCYDEKVPLGQGMDSTLSADMDELAKAQEAVIAAQDMVDLDLAVANTIGYQGVEVNTTANSTKDNGDDADAKAA